jgi:t-SNARE complex subunit (syntaxin)
MQAGRAKAVLYEVQDRHQDIKRIERTILVRDDSSRLMCLLTALVGIAPTVY